MTLGLSIPCQPLGTLNPCLGKGLPQLSPGSTADNPSPLSRLKAKGRELKKRASNKWLDTAPLRGEADRHALQTGYMQPLDSFLLLFLQLCLECTHKCGLPLLRQA